MADRDPRNDPRTGDTVTVAGETREVERQRDGRVYYGWPGKLAVRSMTPQAWQSWASQATTWTLGDGVDTATAVEAII